MHEVIKEARQTASKNKERVKAVRRYKENKHAQDFKDRGTQAKLAAEASKAMFLHSSEHSVVATYPDVVQATVAEFSQIDVDQPHLWKAEHDLCTAFRGLANAEASVTQDKLTELLHATVNKTFRGFMEKIGIDAKDMPSFTMPPDKHVLAADSELGPWTVVFRKFTARTSVAAYPCWGHAAFVHARTPCAAVMLKLEDLVRYTGLTVMDKLVNSFTDLKAFAKAAH